MVKRNCLKLFDKDLTIAVTTTSEEVKVLKKAAVVHPFVISDLCLSSDLVPFAKHPFHQLIISSTGYFIN
jgi:hypothetical protein